MLVKHYLRADCIQGVGQRKNLLLKWGHNHALVCEVWAHWAFCLLKSRYSAKDLPKASTVLGSGHLKTEKKHTKNIFWWRSTFLLSLTYTAIVLSVFYSSQLLPSLL